MCMGVATSNSILVVTFAASSWKSGGRCAARGAQRRLCPPAPGGDDGAGHDHRHGAMSLDWATAASRTPRWAARSLADCCWPPWPLCSLFPHSFPSCTAGLKAAARRRKAPYGPALSTSLTSFRSSVQHDNESKPNTQAAAHGGQHDEAAPEQKPISGSKALAAVAIVLLVAAVLAGYGLWTRHSANIVLAQRTSDLAAPSVIAIAPTQGAPADSFELPGNVSAYTDSPIYAAPPATSPSGTTTSARG